MHGTEVTERDATPPPTIETAPPSAALAVQVRRVHEARGGVLVFQTALGDARADFEQQHAKLIAMARAASETLAAEEESLRRLTLEAFEQTGVKMPTPGVGIRMVKKVEYNQTVVLQWALDHRIALELNTKTYEKLAIADPAVAAATSATVREVPQATIAADLGKVLA